MHENLKFVSVEEFRKLADSPEVVGLAVRSDSIDDIEAKEDAPETRRLTFTISSASVDRDRDKVALDGWDTGNYRKNPVVLWAHNYRQIPVGRSLSEWKDGNKLKSETQFTPKGLDPFNDTVFDLYRMRFMRATSVGFLPKKWNWNEERKGGIDFQEQELLEYSMVPVPANPEALMDAKSAGIDVEPLKKWAENVILAFKSPNLAPQVQILAAIDPKSLAADVASELRRINGAVLTESEVRRNDEKAAEMVALVRRRIEIERFRR